MPCQGKCCARHADTRCDHRQSQNNPRPGLCDTAGEHCRPERQPSAPRQPRNCSDFGLSFEAPERVQKSRAATRRKTVARLVAVTGFEPTGRAPKPDPDVHPKTRPTLRSTLDDGGRGVQTKQHRQYNRRHSKSPSCSHRERPRYAVCNTDVRTDIIQPP